MKRVVPHLAIVLIVLIFIFSLPKIIPKKKDKIYSDEELRQQALSTNMLPVPRDYNELLRIIDNPENRINQAKIALGKKLFFDPILSRDKNQNCASCHNLSEGGDDGLPTAIGYHKQQNPFHLNSPTVLNAALAKTQFWDGRANDVEAQAGGPIQAPFEMNLTPQEVEQRLQTISEYVIAFQEIFDDGIRFENVKKAIGAYERTLLTYGDYDRFLEGNNSAISDKAKRGMALFISKGCKGCHTGMSVGGQSIQQFPLRRYFMDYLGATFNPNMKIKNHPFPFENLGGFLGQNGTLKFRVPILRNISKTAPYFHNGSVKELEEAVRIMSKYQLGNEFTPKQIDEVVAFLKTLDGELVNYIPKEHVRWIGDYEKALIQAKKENKPILLLILKDETKIVKESFQNNAYVKIINENFIPVVVNFEQKQSYPIELFYTTTFPALFFVSSEDESFLQKPILGDISKEQLFLTLQNFSQI